MNLLGGPALVSGALNLILEPLHLSYVIQNEVLRITSEQTRDSDVHPRVYNVADLVIPIPNFIPGYNIGLPGAIHEAINTAWHAQPLGNVQAMPLTMPRPHSDRCRAKACAVSWPLAVGLRLPTMASCGSCRIWGLPA